MIITLENHYSSDKIIDSGKDYQLLSKPGGKHLIET